MVDYGGSAPYYYYKKKKIKPDPLPQPTFSEVDWTVGKYTKFVEDEMREKAKKQTEDWNIQRQKDWIKNVKESLK